MGSPSGVSVEPQLFCEYREIPENESRAEAVVRMILTNWGGTSTIIFTMRPSPGMMKKGRQSLGHCWRPASLGSPGIVMEHLGNLPWKRCLS